MQHTAEEWRTFADAVLHPLFAAFEFLSCLNVEVDELHALYLGISQYFAGSILKILVYRMTDPDMRVRVNKVWSMILLQYSRLTPKHQFTQLKPSSFLDSAKPFEKYPKLKGSGGELKGLTEPLLAVWLEMQDGSDHDKRVTTALIALCGLQEILDDHKNDMFFSVESSKQFIEHMDVFLAEYSWLGVAADARSEALFTGAPKLHWLWHMTDRSRFINPRRVACFNGEDFMKHIKKIGNRSSAGTRLHQISK